MKFLILFLLLSACGYKSPSQSMWSLYLQNASFTEMNDDIINYKSSVYIARGGKYINKQNINKYIQSCELELYKNLIKYGIQVQRIGQEILIIISHSYLINFNESDFSTEGIKKLNIIANTLRKYDALFVEISGYSDAMNNLNNAKLFSQNIAERVGVFFVKSNIDPLRLFIIGKGSTNPIASQDFIGRLTNRRVEIKLKPIIKRF